MTVIRPNSISGVTSITALANEINVFRHNGVLAGLQLNGVNHHTSAGVSTFHTVNILGNLDVAGVLTYQDVTNVDSLGIGTFRTGINVSGGQLDVGSNIKLGNAGVVTATSFVGDGSNLTGLGDSDKIEEGNSSVEVIDTGTGKIDLKVDGSYTARFKKVTGNRTYMLVGNPQGVSNDYGINSGHLIVLANNGSEPATLRLFGWGAGSSDGTINNRIDFASHQSGSGGQTFAKIETVIRGSNDNSSDMTFHTAASGTVSERLRITSNGKLYIGAEVTDFSDAGTFLNLRNNTYGGRIGFSNNTGTAGVTLMEQFAYWGTNKVAGMIATAGTSNSSKDDGYLSFYTKAAGVGCAERLRITSDGHVLIGTSSGGLATGDEFVIHTAGHTGMTIRSGSSSEGNIFFGDSDYGASGIVRYDHSANAMIFKTNGQGTDKLTITSTGLLQGISGQHDGGLELLSGNNNQSTRLRLQSKSSGGTAYNWYLDSARSADRFTIHDGTTSIFTILGTGKVGINETSPDHMFHIKGTSGNNNPILAVESDSWVSGRSAALRLAYTDGNAREIRGHYENGLQFTLNNGEAMRITTGGRLLYGNQINDRGAELQYEGDQHACIGIHRNTNSHGAPSIQLSASRGTSAGSNTIVQNGDYLGMISFKGTDGSDLANGAYITAVVDGSPGGNDMPTRLGFWTSADGSESPVERLRITKEGYVQVRGVTNSATTGGTPLYVGVTGKSTITYGGGNNDTACLRIEDEGGTDGYFHGLEMRSKRGGDVRLYCQDQGNDVAHFVIATDNSALIERARFTEHGLQLTPYTTNSANSGYPISTFTDGGTRFATHLATMSGYSGDGEIICITNFADHTSGYEMFSVRITGYWYGSESGGAIDCVVGCYAGENNFYNATVTGSYPNNWRDNIKFAQITSGNDQGKTCIRLGAQGASNNCEIAFTDCTHGFSSVTQAKTSGWRVIKENNATTISNTYNGNPQPCLHRSNEIYTDEFAVLGSGSGELLTNRQGKGGTIMGMYQYTQMNQGANYNHLIRSPHGHTDLTDSYCDSNWTALITASVDGTSTVDTACTYFCRDNMDDNNSLQIYHHLGNSSSSSNRIYMVTDGGRVAWKMDHSGGYRISVTVQFLAGGKKNGTYNTNDSAYGGN